MPLDEKMRDRIFNEAKAYARKHGRKEIGYYMLNYEAGASAEAKRAAGLVEAQDEYIELLKREIEDMVGIAYAHGWRSDNHEKGAAMREKIEELKTKYNNPK